MKIGLNWKPARAIVAAAALCNFSALALPAAAAPPPVCIQWGWNKCDPVGPRFSPEWSACFDYYTTAGCPWWDGDIPPHGSSATAVKIEDLQALAHS